MLEEMFYFFVVFALGGIGFIVIEWLFNTVERLARVFGKHMKKRKYFKYLKDNNRLN